MAIGTRRASLSMSLSSLEASHAPVDGLTPMHMLAALHSFCDVLKKRKKTRNWKKIVVREAKGGTEGKRRGQLDPDTTYTWMNFSIG